MAVVSVPRVSLGLRYDRQGPVRSLLCHVVLKTSIGKDPSGQWQVCWRNGMEYLARPVRRAWLLPSLPPPSTNDK